MKISNQNLTNGERKVSKMYKFLFTFVFVCQLDGQGVDSSCSLIGDRYEEESNKEFTNMVQRHGK